MNEAVFFGKAINGQMHFTEPHKVTEALSKLQNLDIEVSIQKKRRRSKKGSTAQLRYYYGIICNMIADNTGTEREDIDMQLRIMFHNKVVNGYTLPGSLKNKDCNTVDREDYFTKCRQWASEFLNLWVPKPNETSEYYYEVQ